MINVSRLITKIILIQNIYCIKKSIRDNLLSSLKPYIEATEHISRQKEILKNKNIIMRTLEIHYKFIVQVFLFILLSRSRRG